MGALRDALNIARELLGGRALLRDPTGNGGSDARDLGNGAADLLDRRHRLLGRVLHARNVRRDLVGRFRGLAGERLDLVGDDGETAAGLAGAVSPSSPPRSSRSPARPRKRPT